MGDGEVIGVVGPGRVGTALAMLLAGRGWSVAGAVGRDPGRVATFVGRAGGRPLAGLDELVRTAHVVLVTVRDDALPTVAAALAGVVARAGPAAVARTFVHTSGALPAAVFGGLGENGRGILSLHPVQSVPTVEAGLERLVGADYVLEGNAPGLSWGERVAAALGGRAWRLPSGSKALYHAGASFVANFAVTCGWVGVGLFVRAGLPEDAAQTIAATLLAGVAENVERHGLPQALTGPHERGDVATVSAHLKALEGVARSMGPPDGRGGPAGGRDGPPDVANLYRQLARWTVAAARAKAQRLGGGLAEEAAQDLETLLEGARR